MRRNPPVATSIAITVRALRQEMTEPEQRLWYRLRAKRLGGLHFRRQHPVPPYVVDFCCLSARLIVEVDGAQHGESRDSARDDLLRAQGFRVLRFWNNDVMERFEGVLEAILDAAADRTLSPDPSPGGRGEPNQQGETP